MWLGRMVMRTVVIQLDTEVYRRLKRLAKKRKLTVNKLIIKILEEYLDEK